MIRPALTEETIERLNEECENLMAVDPEEVGVEKRLKVLLENHEEMRRKMANYQNVAGERDSF